MEEDSFGFVVASFPQSIAGFKFVERFYCGQKFASVRCVGRLKPLHLFIAFENRLRRKYHYTIIPFV